MALKDILSNAKYPDDMVLNLPDGRPSMSVKFALFLSLSARLSLPRSSSARTPSARPSLPLPAKFQEAVQGRLDCAGWKDRGSGGNGPR